MRGHEIDCFSRSLPCASCTSSPSPRSASCWGFQAMARAMGAEVVTDHSFAEVGTIWLELTPEVKQDPVFGPLGDRFQVQIGHEDIMTKLPPGATLLASSGTVRNGAFRFDGKPIYCTQFHPELDREGLVLRIAAYPEYLPLTGHRTLEELDPRRCRCRDRVRFRRATRPARPRPGRRGVALAPPGSVRSDGCGTSAGGRADPGQP